MTLALWWTSTRPKTLIASLSPILIGGVASLSAPSFSYLRFLILLITALCIQIGTNFANDYFDSKKGCDTFERKGIKRPVHLGLLSLHQIGLATFLSFTIAALLSLYLIYEGGIWIAVLTLLSLLCGIFYTASPFSLSYLGISDLFVFIFFGPLATAGTIFLQTGLWQKEAWLLGVGSGALSTAILTVNNLRDREEDQKAGKKTLSVRLGVRFSQLEYSFLLLSSLLAFSIHNHRFGWLNLLLIFCSIPLFRSIWTIKNPHRYNALLAHTSLFLWIYTLLLCLCL
jgi:1,4-dihydroxy-2-naphthoate polyprenyltransferase